MNEEMKKAMEEMLSSFKSSLQIGISKDDLLEATTKLEKEFASKFENSVSKSEMEKALEDFSKNITSDIEKLKVSNKNVNAFVDNDTFKRVAKEYLESGKSTIEVKAAASFSSTNAGDAASTLFGRETVSGIQSAPREANVVFPALLKGSTKARLIEWVNRINEDGGSAFIGEGILKPLKDWDYDLESSTAKKVAVRAKVPTEMLKDFNEFRSELEKLLQVDLYEKIETEVLNSTASSTTLTGITTVASSYTTTSLDDLVDAPNFVDAIRACILQMRLLNYKPDVVFINPTEGALLDLIKDANGNYIKIQVEGILRTVRVIETTNITAGYFLLMDTSKWIIKMLEDVMVEFGRDSDDFSKNMISVICEARMHSYYNSINVGAFIYDDFATIKAAIEKPVGV